MSVFFYVVYHSCHCDGSRLFHRKAHCEPHQAPLQNNNTEHGRLTFPASCFLYTKFRPSSNFDFILSDQVRRLRSQFFRFRLFRWRWRQRRKNTLRLKAGQILSQILDHRRYSIFPRHIYRHSHQKQA